MKSSGVIAALLIATFATSGLCQGPALEEKVRSLFLLEHGVPYAALPATLRQLGDDKEIVAVITGLASRHRYARARSPEFLILNGAVASLGALEFKSANELLSTLLADPKVDKTVRALAARSLGQIDPEANTQTLLRALDPTEHYLVRAWAAEGVAKTKDAEALKALEQYSRQEKDSYVRQEFEKAAQALRAKGVTPN